MIFAEGLRGLDGVKTLLVDNVLIQGISAFDLAILVELAQEGRLIVKETKLNRPEIYENYNIGEYSSNEKQFIDLDTYLIQFTNKGLTVYCYNESDIDEDIRFWCYNREICNLDDVYSGILEYYDVEIDMAM